MECYPCLRTWVTHESGFLTGVARSASDGARGRESSDTYIACPPRTLTRPTLPREGVYAWRSPKFKCSSDPFYWVRFLDHMECYPCLRTWVTHVSGFSTGVARSASEGQEAVESSDTYIACPPRTLTRPTLPREGVYAWRSPKFARSSNPFYCVRFLGPNGVLPMSPNMGYP